MAGGFYPPICKSTRRFGGRAGGWLIHWREPSSELVSTLWRTRTPPLKDPCPFHQTSPPRPGQMLWEEDDKTEDQICNTAQAVLLDLGTPHHWGALARTCLANFTPGWQSLLGDCQASQMLRDWLRMEWSSASPLIRRPIAFRTRTRAVDGLLAKGMIKLVCLYHSCWFFSWLFLEEDRRSKFSHRPEW